MSANTLYNITTINSPGLASETVIDGFISDEDVEVLYKRWKDTWPAMLEFPGETLGISCEAILTIAPSTFNRVMGKARGTRIREAAEVNA